MAEPAVVGADTYQESLAADMDIAYIVVAVVSRVRSADMDIVCIVVVIGPIVEVVASSADLDTVVVASPVDRLVVVALVVPLLL
jgi:hypothetical protein